MTPRTRKASENAHDGRGVPPGVETVTIEARGRTVSFPEGEIDEDEIVEVRSPSSLITGLGVAFLICCLLILLLLAVIPHRQIEGIGSANALVGFFGLGGCLFPVRR
jgi:hypothetical protein